MFPFRLTLLALMIFGSSHIWGKANKKCLFVSSYHQGYPWADGVERGVKGGLEGHCEIRQFDMDTKRNKDKEYKERVALEAKKLIEDWKPDVVITADDNAAKFLIVPYFKEKELPFVFCGVNWSAKDYGFPVSNVTGMVEVAPVGEMMERALKISGGKKGFYLGADTLTEEKNRTRFQEAATDLGVDLKYGHAKTTEEWLELYAEAQKRDFVVLGSYSGIEDWNPERVKSKINKISERISLTNHTWMMPYAMYGMNKVPKEHGEWAAQAAVKILEGTKPSDIPIAKNKLWETWINQPLLAVTSVELTELPKENLFTVDGGPLTVGRMSGFEKYSLIGILLAVVGVLAFVGRQKLLGKRSGN